MATAESTHNLTTVAGRKALLPRRDPYFTVFAGVAGASVGFRKTGPKGSDAGTWIARLREEGAVA